MRKRVSVEICRLELTIRDHLSSASYRREFFRRLLAYDLPSDLHGLAPVSLELFSVLVHVFLYQSYLLRQGHSGGVLKTQSGWLEGRGAQSFC